MNGLRRQPRGPLGPATPERFSAGMLEGHGDVPLTDETELAYAPLAWLIQHPSARAWWGKSERAGVSGLTTVDIAIQLAAGMEGVILNMSLVGQAQQQGNNSGVGWQILINRVSWLTTSWSVATGVGAAVIIQDGFFDYLGAGDGVGQSWSPVPLNIPLEENALVEVGMRDNGGQSTPMGWTMYGLYWPTTLRDSYKALHAKGLA